MNKKVIKEWLPYILIIIVVILIRSFIVTPIVVRGGSMDTTLKDGQILLLDKISYRTKTIKRFDIIIIKDTDGDYIIKRVIGLPGDNIEYKNNKLYINHRKVEDKYAFGNTNDFNLEDICNITNIKCKRKIPKNMYLALGDNREISADSRSKGLFKKSQILGKASIRLWPLNKIKVLK